MVARLFISYATPDRAIADEVSGWLRAAGHEPFLAHDLRDGIGVGEAWKQRLYQELNEADAVIGLVTSSFVASEWCFAELGIADARGCRLIPLRAETGVVHPLMRDLQYVDYHADPQQARDRVLQAVRLLDDGGGAWRAGNNPFPGLEPFTATRSRVFFGRTAEAREVGNRLRALGGAGGLLALVGPSGCGKSSLLGAGVAPLLAADPGWLVVPPLVPGSDPVPELARALAITGTRLGLDWSSSDVRATLDAGPDGLRRVVDDLLVADAGAHRRWLVVTIDQAEELFTRTTSDARHRFALLLSGAGAGRVRVVAAMRSEFLDDLRDLPALAGVPIEAYVLAPLGREALREIIATAAVREAVTQAWLTQTRPGGLIIVPWGTDYCNGVMLTLHITTNQRAEVSTTDVHGWDFFDMINSDQAGFAIGMRVPRRALTVELKKFSEDHHILELDDITTRSWARLDAHLALPSPLMVHQLGPRRLWDEAVASYDWWYDHGKPDPTRFGMTMTTDTQTVWLDDPNTVVRDAVNLELGPVAGPKGS